MTLTVTDLFCGAGGSSSGMEQVRGVRVRMAANHWKLAVDTHNANLPHADHDTADISATDPRRYPRTDILWASPECTNHSQAKGKRRDGGQLDLFDSRQPDPSADRSRATMWDVPRFVEAMTMRGRPYKGFVVENVVDARDWMFYPAWRQALEAAGYCLHVVYLNSMFAARMGQPAPQSRDRFYCVGHLRSIPCPDMDKWTRPPARCDTCDTTVFAVQAWKRTDRQHGRYRQQYVWRCPNVTCRNTEVFPSVLPAAVAIDWSLPGQRIGDRDEPLRPKTLARIEAGLRKFARPITLEAAGNTFERRPGVRTWPIDAPLTTQTTTATKALACPPLAVPVEGRDNVAARPVTEPTRTQTARLQDALVVPLRNNGVARPAGTDPLPTVAAAGTHHGLLVPAGGTWNDDASPTHVPFRTRTTRDAEALVIPPAFVMRNNNGRGNGGEMCTSTAEPVRTITTAGHQSLIRWDHLVYGYDTGRLRPVAEPLPTQTTVEGDALLGPAIAVEDCTFRMLDVHEIRAAMAFAPDYVLLGSAKRDKVRMLGNAVTPPAARDLVAALVEAITGEDLPLIGAGA